MDQNDIFSIKSNHPHVFDENMHMFLIGRKIGLFPRKIFLDCCISSRFVTICHRNFWWRNMKNTTTNTFSDILFSQKHIVNKAVYALGMALLCPPGTEFPHTQEH